MTELSERLRSELKSMPAHANNFDFSHLGRVDPMEWAKMSQSLQTIDFTSYGYISPLYPRKKRTRKNPDLSNN